MLGFIFCHGWGHNPNFWDNLKLYFQNYPCIFWDLGYFGKKDISIPIDSSSIKWIGIGHSLGFLTLLNSSISWYKLIGLQGFIDFQGESPSLRRKRTRDFLILNNQFTKDKAMTLKRFHDICGSTPPSGETTSELMNDLSILESRYTFKEIFPCLIIGSKDDLIVTKELIQDNFAQYKQVQIVMHDKGLHSLGFSESEFVKNTIFDFIRC